MTLPRWLRIVRRRLLGPVPAAARRKARRALRVRPRLEALEDRLAPAGFQTLWNFTGGSDGGGPLGTVIADNNGNLYGTTLVNPNNTGNVFRYDASTKTVTNLYDFAAPGGNDPQGGLYLDGSGNLFGATYYGGNGVVSGGFPGYGTLFRIGSDGSNFTTIHSFSGSDGQNPLSTLIPDSKGNLYGTASFGGKFGDGSVFELSPDGTGGYNLNTLFNFGGSNGAIPNSRLLLDGQGNLYGVTYLGGGSADDGTVYRLSPDGSGGYNFQSLHSFTGPDGFKPFSNLLMDSKGDLFGTTQDGGSAGDGTVYELSPDGTGGYNFATIHTFTGSDGSGPTGNWLSDGSGNFYGVTPLGGGPANSGTVYELSPDGSGGYNLNTLHSFTVKDGAQPSGGLTADSSGNIYGTALAAGSKNGGTIFELPGVISVTSTTTTTTANDAATSFSTNTQNVTLKADVTSDAGPVNEGTVTFTVMQGTTVIGTPITSGTVNGGAASVSYALPANLAANTYAIDAVYNPGPDFQGSSENGATLTVTHAHVTTSANSATTYYSPNTQTVNLSTTLADSTIPTDTVDEGTVTFTVMNGTAKLGSASGTVQSNGTASASVALPGGLAAGNYTIDVSYLDSAGNFTDSRDNSAPLTINPANVTTTAGSTSAVYSQSSQTVSLSASVADTTNTKDIVDEGTVLFTIVSGGGATLGTALATVNSSGVANASFTLAAGQPAGIYFIDVKYSDEAGNFSDTVDRSRSLIINPAKVVTTALNATAIFSTHNRSLMLNAVVADESNPNDTVNEGSVFFTIMNGSSEVASAPGAVNSDGTVSANVTLAGGLVAGNYTIDVLYGDLNSNFTNSIDTSATLTINPASVVTTAVNATAYYSSSDQNVTLNAIVEDKSNPSDTVDEGTVYFTILNGTTPLGTVQGAVNSSGAASADFTLLARQAISVYTIAVSYSDNNGNFTDTGDTSATLTIQPAAVTVTAAKPASVVYSTNAQDMTLTAAVANTTYPGDTINEGSVLFTIMNGSSAIRSIAGAVTGGTATADFTLPPGQAAGSYTIDVHYNDSPSNFLDSGDTSSTLTVHSAGVTTTAADASASYSLSSQPLLLNATVTDTSDTTQAVNTGTVTFTIMNGSMKLGSVDGLVSGGTANAAFTLPATQAVGSYTIDVGYTDNQGNYTDNGDTSGTLTVSPVNVTASANNASAFYSPNDQTLTLNANVAGAGSSSQPIGEGIVTFTITDKGGAPVGKSVQGSVSNGAASAKLMLPGGQAIGNYTIGVTYSDSSGNFIDSGNSSGQLAVLPAFVTTSAGNATAVYNLSKQTLNLSAAIADASVSTDTVNEGSVTFTIMNGNATLGTAGGTVSGGTANADFTLPAAQAAGNYTIDVQYSDPSGNFSDGGDTSSALTVSPALVTTTASNVATIFSPNKQTVKLSGSVSNTSTPTDTVNEGTVTFSLSNGSNTLASAMGLVVGGSVNTALTVPAGLAPGSYSLSTTYSDSQGNFKYSGESPATLTIGPAGVTTTADAVSTTYSTDSQSVTLNASVANTSVPSDIVNEGAVTFTILSGSTILGSVQRTVTNGNASAAFTLPAGLAAGSYTIAVNYNDSQGNFSDSGDNIATLTISPANVTTTASAVSTTFSTMQQTVALHAVVADSNNAVGEGVVTFVILNGNSVAGTAAGAVSGGTASANITLPAGLAAGNYTIAVRYSDSQGNFSDNGDNNAMLTIGAVGTSAQLTQVALTPTLLSLTATETLTAHVSSTTAVTQGTVTFLVANHAITANVDGNGNATVIVTLPMLQLLGPQTISVHYNDATNNLTPSTDAQTAAWRIFNAIAPSTATFAPNKDSVTADLFGLFITYTNGLLTEIDFGSIHLVFSYNTAGRLSQVTWDGMNLLS